MTILTLAKYEPAPVELGGLSETKSLVTASPRSTKIEYTAQINGDIGVTVEKEYIVIHLGIEVFQVYLLGSPFTFRINHHS